MTTSISGHSGVLSDEDIRSHVKDTPPLIEAVNFNEGINEGIQPSCYDLAVGHIIHPQRQPNIDLDGRTLDLPPGEMAVIVSLERVNLPKNITGLIIPRNKPAEGGLLILNAGHVDPGYQGHVTAQVINLSRNPYPLRIRDRIFSIIFEYLNTEAAKSGKVEKDFQQRLWDLDHSIGTRSRSFLNVDTLRQEFVDKSSLNTELLKRLWIVVLGAPAVLAAITIMTFLVSKGLEMLKQFVP